MNVSATLQVLTLPKPSLSFQVRDADQMEKTKPTTNQPQVLHALAVLEWLSQGKNVEEIKVRGCGHLFA